MLKENLRRSLDCFAVKGRLFQQIIHKQVEVIENLDWYLTQENYSGIKPDAAIVKVLKGMLELEPEERMSPKKVVEILTASM
jgi:dual specificity tyrosine-phosphorylation-regulated kinase 2/3/4